jgi:hypothetical protein
MSLLDKMTPALRGLRGDQVELGWHLKDVDRGALTGLPRPQMRALNNAIDAGNYTEATLPVRSIYGTQNTVNADFAQAAERYVGDHPDDLPLVVKRGGKYFAQDGHHRLMAAGQEGQTARVRLVDLDGSTPDPDQLRLLSQAPVPTGLLAAGPSGGRTDGQPDGGLLGDVGEYLRRSGRNLGGLLDWLGGGAQAGAEPVMSLMRGDALDQPLLPTATSGGRIGAVASAIGSTLMPVAGPGGALGAGPVLRRATPELGLPDLPVEVLRGRALDMTPEGRAARAAEQRFDADVYHGTPEDFRAFDLSKSGSNVGASDSNGVFMFTNDPAYASEFTWKGGDQVGQVMPLKLKMDNPHYVDFYGQPYDSVKYREAIEAARRAGNDGVVVSNRVSPFGQLSDDFISFDPANIRSRFAAFDPARVGEADLLASRVPNPLGGLLAPQPDDKRKR